MENGSFQNLTLHRELDFEESASDINYPSRIPAELLKSNTLTSLFSQNEDLTARLKLAIQKLAQLEEQNKNLNFELGELKQTHSAVMDQMLIWREKERLWQNRNSNLDAELQVFKQRFPDFQSMEERIARYKKYQEKVKTQIKPYIQQLKGYAVSLHEQIVALNSEIDRKEGQLYDLKKSVEDLKALMSKQAHFYENNQNQLIADFEKERESLIHELKGLKESNEALEIRSQSLDKALERQDELENTLVALRRNKEEYTNQVQEELEKNRLMASEWRQKLKETELLNRDLHAQLKLQAEQIETQQAEKLEFEEQISNLRYMWTTKSEENEKLKLSLSSLEKLNAELSSQLSRLK